MKSFAWQPENSISDGLFLCPRFARRVRVFPLGSLSWLHGQLSSRLQKSCRRERRHWHGLRLLAGDKTNLTLPESQHLWKNFGSHGGSRGLGPIAIELCCLFDLVSRAPLRFVYGRASTSEHKLIPKLIGYLKKGDLLLLDTGFYYCVNLRKIMARFAHFIIPSREDLRPRILNKLAESDYLCEIKDYSDKTTVTVRIVFVHRNGFRRRRLVTSLLDHIEFPASELAKLYHMRWDIETFYRDFKVTLRVTCWHCQTPESFHRELLVHMIVCCLIRISMLGACRFGNLSIGQLSFTRALTETRLFLKRLVAGATVSFWASIWETYVLCCARYRVKYKPNRQFARDQQEYRRKSRGLEKRRKGPKSKYAGASPTPKPETRKDLKGQEILLS